VRNAPVSLHEEYIAEVIGIGHEGEGVGRVNGFTLFIPGALPGERVRVRITGLRKQFGRAELVEVLAPSPDRIAPPCPVFSECGGCQLQHLRYEAQLLWKQRMVRDNLERIGRLNVGEGGVVVHPVIGMDDPWRYRNKVEVPIGEREGGLVGGFYASGTHEIVDADECLIRHESGDEVVRKVKEIAERLGISAYDEATGKGHLRHVIVKTGFRTGEIMVVLVTGGEELPQAERLAEEIVRAVPGVASVCRNINPGRAGAVMGEKTEILRGRDRIYDAIGDIRFAISPRSFYQVNPRQTEILYTQALQYAGLTGEETVIDAYCGVGTISLFLARKAKRVYGVELIPEAVEDARRNAELNGIRNAQFAVGRAEDVIPAWRKQGIVPDVIVVDPPRRGCDASLLETMIAMRPQRIVYVSCNPSTLARDLRVLEDGGFRTVEVQPVDMFPHTSHVECVIGICRDDT
jgi:23S rRNA (uracil1939-C5)-methyltransferase